MKKRFYELNPVCYALARRKEICRRHMRNLLSRTDWAKDIRQERLPVVVSAHSSNLIKRAKGIDITLQENKAVNIDLACRKMHGLVIHPGETFSFWKLVGNATRRKGYKDGRVLINNRLRPGPGGGLCNLANTIHLLVLHSPLTVTELHTHSDALAPDEGKRVPFSSGTSVNYNDVDFRFANHTDQDFQLLLWCADEKLHGELRCCREIPYRYELTEEDHHFRPEGEKYYRVSRIYKDTIDRTTGALVEHKLVRDNHSEVMFDSSLIPRELIRADG